MSFIGFACLPVGYRDLTICRDFESQEPTYEQWKSVLHLSTRWGFASLRKLALKSIRPPTSHDQLVLARTYSVEEWVLPALTALCSRSLPLSLDEARQMDIEDVILVASVREEIRDGALRVDVTDISHYVEAAQAGKLDHLVGYRAKAEAKAEATHEVEAKVQAEAEATHEAKVKEQAEAEAKKKREAAARAKAEARAKVEARAKTDADAKAKAEADAWAKVARAKVEAIANAKADADAWAKAEDEARAKADADAKAKANADAWAKADADAAARVKAITEAMAEAEAAMAEKEKEIAKQRAADRAAKAAARDSGSLGGWFAPTVVSTGGPVQNPGRPWAKIAASTRGSASDSKPATPAAGGMGK